jgi:hypothetical protein
MNIEKLHLLGLDSNPDMNCAVGHLLLCVCELE